MIAEMIALMLIQQHPTSYVSCDLELVIPTGRNRRNPKSFEVDCPALHNNEGVSLQEYAENLLDQIDMDFDHEEWTTWQPSLRFRRYEDGSWEPVTPQMLVFTMPEFPRRVINSGYRHLDCAWAGHPDEEGVLQDAMFDCQVDGQVIPENLRRPIDRALSQAFEQTRILPLDSSECVEDRLRISVTVFRYSVGFGRWNHEGFRAQDRVRFAPMCPQFDFEMRDEYGGTMGDEPAMATGEGDKG